MSNLKIGIPIVIFIGLLGLQWLVLYLSKKKITFTIVFMTTVISLAFSALGGVFISSLQSDGYADIQQPSGNTSSSFTPTSQRSQTSTYTQTNYTSTTQSKQTGLERSNASNRSLTYISFSKYNFTKGSRLHVYSAPSKSSWHTKASDGGAVYASTNGDVYVAGCDGNWVLIKYTTNSGSERMGYTLEAQGSFGSLSFDYYPGTITTNCHLSDGSDSIPLAKGKDNITVLGRMSEGIYIETDYNGKQARGVVPESCVQW